MERAEKFLRLKSLLTQIAPGNAIEAVSRPTDEAIDREGFESLGPNNVAAAESGLQKLAEDRVQEITPSEMFGLEAIVLPRNRPAVFVRGDSYDDLDGPWAIGTLPSYSLKELGSPFDTAPVMRRSISNDRSMPPMTKAPPFCRFALWK